MAVAPIHEMLLLLNFNTVNPGYTCDALLNLSNSIPLPLIGKIWICKGISVDKSGKGQIINQT